MCLSNRKVFSLLAAVMMSLTVAGQGIAGRWDGKLQLPSGSLRVVFHISKTDTGWSSVMDSPDQGAKGIPASSTEFHDSVLTIALAAAGIAYEGRLDSDSLIVGTFRQSGYSFPLTLSRAATDQVQLRPQDPTPPYPYRSEDVFFQNAEAGIRLAGTLTLPAADGKFPVVVLVSGSGSQNRNSEVFDHRPFWVLADYLTRRGMAVLRYDDRGVGASEGDPAGATTADIATDAASAVAYLKSRSDIDGARIGIIGHSEGGLIAPMVAAAHPGDVACVVLLAAPGVDGGDLLLLQQQRIAEAAGADQEDIRVNKALHEELFDILKTTDDESLLNDTLTAAFRKAMTDYPSIAAAKPAGMSDEAFIAKQVARISSPWLRFYVRYDPAPALAEIDCPVLVLNGEKDLQVPAAPNLAAIRKALDKGDNKNVTVKQLPGLNHLFQECATGLPGEYGAISQTISPEVLEIISSWLLAHGLK